jgi:hypothetical protein
MGRIYWCFVDFEKTCDFVDKEELWLKVRTEVSEISLAA